MPAHALQQLPVTGGGMPPAGLWTRLRDYLARRVAGIGAHPLGLQLGAGQQLRLHDAAGWAVVCRSGSLWMTQEADTRDIFLDAGESFTMDRGGLALILARQDAALSIRPPVSGQAERGRMPGLPGADADPPPPAPASAREAWLKALYPE